MDWIWLFPLSYGLDWWLLWISRLKPLHTVLGQYILDTYCLMGDTSLVWWKQAPLFYFVLQGPNCWRIWCRCCCLGSWSKAYNFCKHSSPGSRFQHFWRNGVSWSTCSCYNQWTNCCGEWSGIATSWYLIYMYLCLSSFQIHYVICSCFSHIDIYDLRCNLLISNKLQIYFIAVLG